MTGRNQTCPSVLGDVRRSGDSLMGQDDNARTGPQVHVYLVMSVTHDYTTAPQHVHPPPPRSES